MSTKETVNIASHLPILAAAQPHTPAVVFPHSRDKSGRVSYTHYTFRQLDDESRRLARGLLRIGIGPGVRTVLMVKPSLEFFALTFALFRAGAVPVLIDPGMGIKSLGKCLKEAQPEAFIGIPKAHLARRLLGWARGSIHTCVTVSRRRTGAGYTLEEVLQIAGDERDGMGAQNGIVTHDGGAKTLPLSSAEEQLAHLGSVELGTEDKAAILFTSGSTGVPKGAVYTHGVFNAQVEIIREIYGITPGEIDLATFPLFALFAPALGMTAIVPDMDATRPGSVNPTRIVEAIENFGVTNLFGSPALLRRVGDYCAEQGIHFPTLRRVISAGAPVPADVLERFAGLLQADVQVFTPYGATESLPVCSIGSAEILTETRQATEAGKGVCVGRPVPGAEVRIVRITDDPMPTWNADLEVEPGSIGEIIVSGPMVTRTYYNRPQSNPLAKIQQPDGDGFYHRMGDLGYFDKQGRVWFCGRKSQRVATNDRTLYTIPCEGIFNTHSQVFRSALVGVRRGDTTEPVLCVELEKGVQSADRKRLAEELLGIGKAHETTQPVSRVLFHPAFPVDIRHNAKIFREKLSDWASRQLS